MKLLGTEERIKKATADLLLKDGQFGITINEIAQRLQVSRTLIHYYFRSKENLFDIVCKEVIEKYVIPRFKNLFSEKGIQLKIKDYIDETEKVSMLYPYLDLYIISQLNYNETVQPYLIEIQNPLKNLISEIQKEIEKGNIFHSHPVHFLIDLFSLSSYSYIYARFFHSNRNVFPYELKPEIFKHRKEMILEVLLKKCN